MEFSKGTQADKEALTEIGVMKRMRTSQKAMDSLRTIISIPMWQTTEETLQEVVVFEIQNLLNTCAEVMALKPKCVKQQIIEADGTV